MIFSIDITEHFALTPLLFTNALLDVYTKYFFYTLFFPLHSSSPTLNELLDVCVSMPMFVCVCVRVCLCTCIHKVLFTDALRYIFSAHYFFYV